MIRSLAAALLTAALTTGAVHADDYPNRPVKIIVPTPPGGPVDVIARITANYLQNALGKGMVVENRAGAGNTIGSKDAAEATPDGYTLLYSSATGLAISPLLHPDAGYDPLKSFDPIALVGESSNILVVNPAVPANTGQELVAYAKADPGKVNFSSGGIGVLPHLVGENSNILVVNPSVPANTVQELVAYAKANPGKVNFSSGGIGVLPHLIGE